MSQSGSYSTGGIPIGTITSLTGNTGGPVLPTAGNINVVGAGIISVTGNPGTSTLTISSTGGAATFDGDTGSATPALGVINIVGSSNINTTASGNTVEVILDDDVVISGSFTAGTTSGFITAVTGDITITAGNLNLTDTNSAGTVGVITFEGDPWLHDYGSANTFVGLTAGNFTLDTGIAISNTGIGFNALNSLTEGFGNTCVGSQCGQLLTTNGANTAVGQAALGNAGEPCVGNTAIGFNALEASTTGIFNCALGYLSGNTYNFESNNLVLNNMGQSGDAGVIRIGTQGTGDGQQNTCYIAGIIGNTIIGGELVSIDSVTGQLGSLDAGIFSETFTTDTTPAVPIAGIINIAGGSNINTSGATNVVTINLDNTVSISGSMTAGTGFTATTGNVSISAGNLTLPNTLSTGSEGVITFGSNPFIANYGVNVFVGANAGNTTLTVGTANHNTAIGNASQGDITVGHDNTSLGFDCLLDLTSGSVNTAIGSQVLTGLLTGSGNLAIGSLSGGNYVNAESNNILISNPGVISESNTIRIGVQGGGTLQQDTCYIAGIIGNTVASAQLVTINSSTGQLGVTSSGAVSSSFTTDSGTATPSSGVINIKGGSNINTSGATNIVTVNLDNTVSISGSMTAGTGLIATSGGITATGTSNINISGSAITTIGTGGTGATRLGNATGNTAVTGSLTATVNLATSGGNILLPTTTSSTVGVVVQNGNYLMHTFGANSNFFAGIFAGNFTLTGIENTVVGRSAFSSGTSGRDNTIMGYVNSDHLTTGSQNTSIGSMAMQQSISSASNCAFGYASLQSMTSGSFNVAVGFNCGSSYAGAESSNILVLNSGTVSESNVIRIGTQGTGNGQQNTCFIAGITGATVTGSAVLCSSTGQLGTIVSSIRFKENIIDISEKSSDILSLRPVIFNYKEDPEKQVHYGLIAEEVQGIFPDLVLYDEDGTISSVEYHELPVLLLNELKKSNDRIEILEKLVNELMAITFAK